MTRTPRPVALLAVWNGVRRSKLGLSPALDGIRNVVPVVDGMVVVGGVVAYDVPAAAELMRYAGWSVATTMS
jgi:hypothetical protein